MNKYVLISTAKNEESYIERTITTILNQSIRPYQWVIVNDNSTDDTNNIIASYASNHDFITLLQSNSNPARRSFQSKVHNLNYALTHIKDTTYHYIGILDTDIELPVDYYERMLTYMQEDDRLGIVGGWTTEEDKGIYVPRKINRIYNVQGAVQFFRKECFKQIGNFYPLPYGGEDALMSFIASMNNWDVRSFKDVPYRHLRKTSYTSSVSGSLKYGKADQTLGYPLVYVVVKGISRLFNEPYVAGSLAYLTGFILARFALHPSYRLPENIRSFIHHSCMERMKTKFINAVRMIHEDS